MHRVTRATLGTVAIGLVAVFIVVGMVGGNLVGQVHSGSATSAKGTSVGPAAKAVAAVAPAAHVNPSAITLTAAFTAPTPWPGYNYLPLVVNFTIAVTGSAINNVTTMVVVNVSDQSLTPALQISSTALSVAPGQTTYTFTVDSSTLLCNDASCSAIPQDEYGVSAFIGVYNSTTTFQNNTTISHNFFIITTPLAASLISPLNSTAVTVGNVTTSVAYIGSWIAGVNLYIYSASGTEIFSHSFIEFVSGIPNTATWFIGQPGSYKYSVQVTTVYLPALHYFNGTLTVIQKGGTVYQNSTKWTNTTIISGLSGAAAGTILLVVGLIVGMIVALVLARAVMGRPAQAPPQPWEGKPGATPAANTCSVCGKSFGTPEELAAHGKSEHGMQ